MELHSQSCNHMDDEIYAVAQQLQELQEYLDSQKGKCRADDNEDYLQVFGQELRAHKRSLEDNKLASSIAVAVHSDSQVIATITREEAQASDDRRLAIRINERNDDSNSSTTDCAVEQPQAATEPQSSDDECIAGPSMTYRERQALELEKSAATETRCCVCYESFFAHKMKQLDCNHNYCDDCLKDLFLRATKDSTLFPPRCCRMPIHLEAVQEHMSQTEMSDFKSAEIEFSTTDRTYCSNTSCGKFILPQNITAGRAECPHCNLNTCAMCKKAFHIDDCVEDTDLQATLALASAQGWQRCFRCRALVDLGFGCYHITCKCRAEICYLCGLQWKTCECVTWDEGRLLARAAEVVDRQAPAPLAPPIRDILVQRMRANLMENHECEHRGRFRRLEGSGWGVFECEICGARHRKYILECRQCQIVVCENCRRNRI
ncbi:hypothetical protein BO85DRAFT_470556 [Aspergillus piperis CBS 112811]|uniref:RBR-type E3 ubiquitin transferase n=1 Tax=Aspergillus piperis CBS 112811 TaxID=1448313 RepID=A0A8G1VK01_9EURO|nr:hypothetical protein BO85DRAFT_470556 [Aspergillus piperis CBS 112811]RAH55205.1 hypothetical protein BO85DRAFT_470556 [Aspergillus piperis CBS 112811]